MNNCGVVVSFREIYGSESLTQVTMLFLDTIDLFNGIFLFYLLKMKLMFRTYIFKGQYRNLLYMTMLVICIGF